MGWISGRAAQRCYNIEGIINIYCNPRDMFRSHRSRGHASDRTGLEAIWSSRWSTPFTGFGSIDLIDGVAWIKAGGAPRALQLIPLREED